MSEPIADYLLQISHYTRISGKQKVLEAIQSKLLGPDEVRNIFLKLTDEVSSRLPDKTKINFVINKNEREGVVIYLMHSYYGITHPTMVEIYQELKNEILTIPAISQKYSRIASMKKSNEKEIFIHKLIRELERDLPSITGTTNEKKARGYKV